MEKIKITKKTNDGAIDNGDLLFDSVDAYGGDHVTRIIELAPLIPGNTVQHVKIRFGVDKNGGKNYMTPIKSGDYRVESEYYKGFKYYLENINGVRYIPDEYGVFNITNALTSPLEIVLHLIVEKFSVTDLEQSNFMEDGQLYVWSK